MRTANDFLIIREIESWAHRFRAFSAPVVLDLGCGKSPYANFLTAVGARVVSADLTVRGERTQVLADAAHLPFRSEQFDGVLFSEVLEHVPQPFQVMAEISRVIKPGGLLFLSTPMHYSMHEIPYDFFRPTEYGLSAMLDHEGISIARFLRRGGLLTVVATVFLQWGYILFAAPSRLPVIGRAYKATVFPVLLSLLEMVSYVNFLCVSRNRWATIRLHECRGIGRALMLWTNGYCIVGEKKPV